jgi:acyl-CoA dehydrogenase
MSMNIKPIPMLDDEVNEVRLATAEIVNRDIVPNESDLYASTRDGSRPSKEAIARAQELRKAVQDKVKKAELWAPHLPPEFGGMGLSFMQHAYMNEIVAYSPGAAPLFGVVAPNSGNQKILVKYGTPEQHEKWLIPLTEGRMQSGFSMTEPMNPGSDPRSLTTRAELDGDEWVISGEKFYISGAGDVRCKIMICMVVTDPDAPKHNRQSQILVPMDAEGVEVVRPMQVFGRDDAPHGHMHIKFHNVRVPENNLILGRGRGFEISQGRLGPGRIHHCMRSIGAAEKALDLMCKRAVSREAFGKPLAELGGNYDIIADSRIEIEMCRLLTFKTAWLMDTIGNKAARDAISQIKVAVPNMALKVIDRAIQMHGAAGISQDFPLAALWTSQRTLRLADGPDEVHRRVIARKELAKYT